jgi:DNA-binding response OmpR family regulator
MDASAAQRALVVDDADQVRELLVTGLQRAGYRVDGAASLAEAVALGPETYDALIIDLQLGAERGAELVELLRARDPAAVSRCVLMTGGGLPDDLPGDIPVLIKPFRFDELIAAVRGLPTLPP